MLASVLWRTKVAAVLAAPKVDWDYVNAEPERPDLGCGDSDDEAADGDGDAEGHVHNIYHGARSLLARQAAVWPHVAELVFSSSTAAAQDLVPAGVQLKACYTLLEELSSAPLGGGKPRVTDLVELLTRPSRGIPDLLAAAGTSSAAFVPPVLWNWLLDLAAFHPVDAVRVCVRGILMTASTGHPRSPIVHAWQVGAAAAFCLSRISALLPQGQCLGGGDDEWDGARPLGFDAVCRQLCALGLDPLAEDPCAVPGAAPAPAPGVVPAAVVFSSAPPTPVAPPPSSPPAPSSSFASPSSVMAPVAGLGSRARPERVRPLFHGPGLSRSLEVGQLTSTHCFFSL